MKNSRVFAPLGASSHALGDRQEHDYYATDPIAIDRLLEVEKFNGAIWECACGQGHMSKRLKEYGHDVISTDLIDRGYGKGGVDFFHCTETKAPNIITNPPYKLALEFVQHSLFLLPEDGKLAMFLKLTFLESEKRRELFEENPPKYVYVFRKRILCAINGEFERLNSSAIAYAWYVWEKGYKGDTVIKWIN